MNISLTPEFDAYVQEKVKSGVYNSVSEVICEGLRLLKGQDLLRELTIGIEQLERGESITYATSQELAAEIKANL